MSNRQPDIGSELTKLLRTMNDRDLQRISVEIKAEIQRRKSLLRADPETLWNELTAR